MSWKEKIKDYWKNGVYKSLGFLIAYAGQRFMKLLLLSCRWEVEGLENFKRLAKENKCILSIWHNRLALAPSILSRLAPDFVYAALISKSRDGELISAVVNSYKKGRSIRVAHQNRHQAVRDVITHLEKWRDIVIITPDGPRGPVYKVKPGIGWMALETGAMVIQLNWTASSYWEFNTWDKLRIPKPFSTIQVVFGEAQHFEKAHNVQAQDVTNILQKSFFK